jgi:hypothetical protein
LANDLKAALNPNRDVDIGSGNRTEDLPPAIGCLDVADAHLQMPVASFTAADEGRVRGDGDAAGLPAGAERS